MLIQFLTKLFTVFRKPEPKFVYLSTKFNYEVLLIDRDESTNRATLWNLTEWGPYNPNGKQRCYVMPIKVDNPEYPQSFQREFVQVRLATASDIQAN
jgi:hypothetical protein